MTNTTPFPPTPEPDNWSRQGASAPGSEGTEGAQHVTQPNHSNQDNQPTEPQPAASQPAPQASPQGAATPHQVAPPWQQMGGSAPRIVRSGPIFWGVVFLFVCGWAVQRQFMPDLLPTGVWIAGATLSLGVILLIVGIVAAIRGSRG